MCEGKEYILCYMQNLDSMGMVVNEYFLTDLKQGYVICNTRSISPDRALNAEDIRNLFLDRPWDYLPKIGQIEQVKLLRDHCQYKAGTIFESYGLTKDKSLVITVDHELIPVSHCEFICNDNKPIIKETKSTVFKVRVVRKDSDAGWYKIGDIYDVCEDRPDSYYSVERYCFIYKKDCEILTCKDCKSYRISVACNGGEICKSFLDVEEPYGRN